MGIDLHPIVAIILLAAVIAAAATQLAVWLLPKDPEPRWRDPALRLISAAMGGLVGALCASAIEQPLVLMLLVGLGAGSQATIIVNAGKKLVGK